MFSNNKNKIIRVINVGLKTSIWDSDEKHPLKVRIHSQLSLTLTIVWIFSYNWSFHRLGFSGLYVEIPATIYEWRKGVLWSSSLF